MLCNQTRDKLILDNQHHRTSNQDKKVISSFFDPCSRVSFHAIRPTHFPFISVGTTNPYIALMLAFMAYPPTRTRGSSASITDSSLAASTKEANSFHERRCHDSVTTASLDERPPQSFLSLSTEASSAIWDDDNEHLVRRRLHQSEESDQDLHRKAKACCADHDATPQRTNTTAMYIERIYENTVHGPCQSVTTCEVEHLDLFMVS